jgi:hypothetical protein
MNFLTILSALYGLTGAFYLVGAKLRLHRKVRSGNDKVQLGHFITQTDRESTEDFIDILGFLLIGFSFFTIILSEFTTFSYVNVRGIIVALIANLAAIFAVFSLGFVRLTKYSDGTPTTVPPNVPIKLLYFCILCADLMPILGVLLRFFDLETDWIAVAALFGVPFSIQFLLPPLLMGAHLIQGDRARASPWVWWMFLASLLCIALGFVVTLLIPSAILVTAPLAAGLFSIGTLLWLFATISISF